jgi:putative ABC transport system permease protein
MSVSRYRRLLGRRPAQEADAELQFHIDMRVQEYLGQGMSEADARRLALARLGDFAGARAGCIEIDQRLQRRETMAAIWETLVQDIRLAARMLARQKLWTVLAVLTLGIGIGANSALFSIIHAVLLRPLPFAEPDRIMSLTVSAGGRDLQGVEEPAYLAWKERVKSFSSLAAYGQARAIMKGAGDPEMIVGRVATYGYFSVFGTRPLLGRTFTPDEDKPGAPAVIVLSEQIWRRIYNADSSIVNRTILLDGTPVTVIGVMPAEFTKHGSALFWRPYRMRPPNPERGIFYTSVMGRLAPGASLETARAELEATLPKPTFGGEDVLKPVVMTLQERRYGDTRPPLLMLFAAVAVLLLIACANVANLLLARAARRQREFALRSAIGASAWRLVRFTLCESMLLSMMGAAVGLMIAAATLGTFVRLSPPTIARAEGIAVNGTVMLFTFGLATLTGLVFGLIPALQIRRVDLNAVLTNGSARTAGGARQSWTRRSLVVVELATALMLLTGAGLLLKSFATVTSIDPGVDPRRIVVTTIDLPRRYEGATVSRYFDDFVRGVAAIPGVESVAITDAPPLGGSRMSRLVEIAGGPKMPRLDVSQVQSRYFRAAGMVVVAGRVFDDAEVGRRDPVAVLNETAAHVFGRGSPVVGQRLPLNGAKEPPVMIIGVVRDVLQRGVEAEVVPMMFQPLPPADFGNYMTIVTRTRVEPRSIVPAIGALARRLDPLQPVPETKTLEERMAVEVAPRKFSFVLVGSFAMIGALLAVIGLYGVMSYLVAERTNEIGVRIALGADSGRITRFVVGEGAVMAAIGVVLGLAGSVAAVRLLRTMLFKVSIYDPMIFAGAAMLLVLTALVACAVPARRAAKLDPVDALRAG